MEILISVIIPVYNGEKYISRAIDSLINQTYKNIEIIVVNDGSNDSTEEIVKSYGKQVRYYFQENKGVSTARNLGLENAKGAYIGFLDSDDYVLPSMYNTLINCSLQTNADIAMCNFFLEYKNGLRIKAMNIKDKTYNIKRNKDLKSAFNIFGNSSCNKLYRKTIIKDIKFPSYKRGEDALFVLEAILKSNKFNVSNEPLYIYFQNKYSVTKSGIDLSVIDNYIDIHSEKKKLLQKYNKIDVLNSKLENYYIKTFLTRTNAIRKVENKKYKSELWNKWLNSNKTNFLSKSSFKYIFSLSNNINWVYYIGMIITGNYINPALNRLKKKRSYFFNEKKYKY